MAKDNVGYIPEIQLYRPLPIAIVLIVAACLAAFLFIGRYPELICGLNDRSDRIYDGMFTFLTVLFGASLTIWSMLKSRSTRYIEALHDNVIFQKYILQLERRIAYLSAMLLVFFVIYSYSLDINGEIGINDFILVSSLGAYFAAVSAMLDCLYTARAVLR